MVSASFSRPLWLRALLPLLLLTPAGLSALEIIENGTRSRPEFNGVHLLGTESFRGRDTTQDIRLRSVSYMGDPDNLLYLDFDTELPALLKDVSGHFRIRESSYISIREARIGSGAALFNRADNRIVIDSPEELWPGPGELSDFTIELWLKPGHYYNKNMIFQKAALEPGMLAGEKKSLELFIQREHVYFHLENLFTDENNKKNSLTLVSRETIPLGRWTHLTLTYQAGRNRLAMYLNGREDRVIQTVGGWRAGFSKIDRSPLVIGGNYSGHLDEFRISGRAISPERGENNFTTYAPMQGDAGREFQPGGEVLSEVTRLKEGRIARTAKLRYSADLPTGTILKFWVRFSRQRFDRDTPERLLPWYRVDRMTDKLPPFSYVQWKAELKADPLGHQTPVLKEVAVEYSPFETPGAPKQIQIVPGLTGDRQICLEWSANPQGTPGQGMRYSVYYGVRPGEYTGMIQLRVQDGRTLPIELQKTNQLPLSATERVRYSNFPEMKEKILANRVRLIIDNDLIIANMKRSGRLDMPLLENDRAYYFAVTAFTLNRDLKQESDHSQEISTVLKPRPDLR